MKTESQIKKTVVPGSIKKRMTVTVGIIVCGFCVLIFSLANLSIMRHDELSEQAINQQLRDTVVTAQRGTIYDANMNILAKSETVWTVALSPKQLQSANEDFEVVATGLSEILGVDYDSVLEKCSENNYYSIVKRKVDQPIVDEIRNFIIEKEISGISFTEDWKRYYYYGNFASTVIGFVGTDNQGLAGLEAYYDEVLSGTAGRVVSAKNAVGSDMYYEYETRYDAKAGDSLVLTIDEVIQHYLEKHLEAAVEEHNVENRAVGIVMNVKTGAILAMATKGDFDPNDPLTIADEETRAAIDALAGTDEYYTALGEAQQFQWRNKAISDFYYPGSVFKIVTASAALDTGSSTLNDYAYYCTGTTTIANRTYSCATGGHGSEDFVHCVINSCNCAFINIGQRLGIQDFGSYFEAFGLTQKTGIDLPGEGAPAAGVTYHSSSTMSIVDLASSSFGQSNTVTPIQMITAISAAVNGGYLVTPHLVSQVIDEDGSIVEAYDSQIKRQAISTETSKLMAETLEQVVIYGNSQNAYVAGYRIGGKSGTAEKQNGNEGEYIASFCGFAPADDPEIAVLILFDTAHSYSIYGGTIVAPVVASVMADVLPYMGVDPIYTEEELENADVQTPVLTGIKKTQADSRLNPLGLSAITYGEGDTVTEQFPLAGQSIPRGSNVVLYFGGAEAHTVEMPDLSGATVSSASATLKALGLNIRTEGAAFDGATAMEQSVAAGESVQAGSVITVKFINNSVNDR